MLLLLSVSAPPVYAADVIVDTVSDIVDGDVSSPRALIANPGPNGISLREAIQATNNAPGPHTIGFADTLAGQTIALNSPLFVTRDGVTLTGLPGPDGQPSIVLDGRGMTIGLCCRAILFIHASDFSLTRLKITGVTNVGIVIRAGETMFPPSAPQQVKNIRIEHNIFDNSGVDGGLPAAIRVWMDPEGGSVGATIANVRIAHNTFRHYTDSGIIVNSEGTACTIRDLVIQANTFDDIWAQLELASNRGSGNRIIGSRIIGNRFLNGTVPILVGHIGYDRGLPTSENLIADTMIRGNVFSGNLDSL